MTYTVSSGTLNSTIPYHHTIHKAVLIAKLIYTASASSQRQTDSDWKRLSAMETAFDCVTQASLLSTNSYIYLIETYLIKFFSTKVYASRFFLFFFFSFFIVFLFLCVCVCVCVCVCSFLFYGSSWSDSNKERKKRKKSHVSNFILPSQSVRMSDLIQPCRTEYWLLKVTNVLRMTSLWEGFSKTFNNFYFFLFLSHLIAL